MKAHIPVANILPVANVLMAPCICPYFFFRNYRVKDTPSTRYSNKFTICNAGLAYKHNLYLDAMQYKSSHTCSPRYRKDQIPLNVLIPPYFAVNPKKKTITQSRHNMIKPVDLYAGLQIWCMISALLRNGLYIKFSYIFGETLERRKKTISSFHGIEYIFILYRRHQNYATFTCPQVVRKCNKCNKTTYTELTKLA